MCFISNVTDNALSLYRLLGLLPPTATANKYLSNYSRHDINHLNKLCQWIDDFYPSYVSDWLVFSILKKHI